MSKLEQTIQSIVARAANDIASVVRAGIQEEINHLIGAGAAPPAAVKRGPGRPKKQAAEKAAPAPKPVKAAKPSKKGGRRSSEQVTADNDKLLAFIKAHPEMRSEAIQKAIGMNKPNVASGLQTLRDSGKIKMKGIKRAATYTAA